MKKQSAAEIKTGLTSVAGWRKKGKAITRTFEREDFVAAMRFVNGVARLAEKAAHHPDIDIRWNRVTLTLSTHAAGGLTAKDFALAARLNRRAGPR